MIKSNRRARMLIGCVMHAGDPAVVIERLAQAAALRFVTPGDDEWRMGLMIFAMPKASNRVAGSRWDCGFAVPGIWLT